ncbi:hypothetical protein AZL_a09060 (plasmid) [Azospirillum sp. B510]|uniref:DMT family transporter n=1 Tax=Azospirillum sp. (strain B510) TaxID=137722 RepID=UPI0001C4BBEB|nr:DMT family transporter [Azospirillum sp. B510]BAI74437.1 hypothetical protein AZL_a09060 [Azospirillum sp. B510]
MPTTSIVTAGPSRAGTNPALASLLAGALAIALAPILVRVSELEPVATAFHRLVIALPFFWLGMLAEREAPRAAGKPAAGTPAAGRPVTPADMALMGLAGMMLAGDLALWHLSITMTSVAKATLFNNCAPVFVALFGWLLFGERIGLGLIVALAVSLSGMALLIGGGLVEGGLVAPVGSAAEGQWRGDAVAVGTAAFYAVYLMAVKRLRAGHSTSVIMAGSSAAAALVLAAAAWIEGGPLLPATAWGWAVVLALGVACHVIGQGLITHALAHLPVTFSSIGLLIQPVAAAGLAWMLFGEALGPLQWLGGGLALAGITLARRGSGR